MARKQYNLDEVLTHLARRKNIKAINGSLDIGNADIIGNKTLGMLSFCRKYGWFTINEDIYKKKHNLLKEENETSLRKNERSKEPIHNGKQQLELWYGNIPSFANLGTVDRTVFKHTKEEKEKLKSLKSH